MQTFDVITYDLWGNDRDGYEVNDAHKSGTIDIDPEWSDKRLILELKREGWLRRNIRLASITIDGEPDYTLYLNYKGWPGLELRNQNPPKFIPQETITVSIVGLDSKEP